MPRLSDRVGTFTDSVIRRMTRINNQYDSINLSQGFPDFDPPKELTDALAKAAHDGPHQYAVTFGAQNFREALAKKTSPALHHEVDPNTEICVTCGGTEATAALPHRGSEHRPPQGAVHRRGQAVFPRQSVCAGRSGGHRAVIKRKKELPREG